MGQVFEFGDIELMNFPFGVVVIGRCWQGEFGIGDVFTELRWTRNGKKDSPLRYEQVAADISGEVLLRVEEISAYERLIERVYTGLTAGIRFSGTDLEALARIDFVGDLRAGKSWSLWGQRQAGP